MTIKDPVDSKTLEIPHIMNSPPPSPSKTKELPSVFAEGYIVLQKSVDEAKEFLTDVSDQRDALVKEIYDKLGKGPFTGIGDEPLVISLSRSGTPYFAPVVKWRNKKK